MPSGGSAWPRGLDELGNDRSAAGRGGIGITVAGRWLRRAGGSGMTTASSWHLGVPLGDLTRVSLASALFLQPAPPRQVPSTMLMAGWLIVVAAIIAVGVAAAIRWPSAAAALAFRAGYAAGLAWARLRTLGTRLVDGVRRMIE